MKQAHFISIFFCSGLLLGSLLSVYFVSRDQWSSYARLVAPDLDMTTSSPEQQTINDAMREINRLRLVIEQLNSTSKKGKEIIYIHKEPTSHTELDLLPSLNRTVIFKDNITHKDDRSVADKLAKEIRVLCWIMTCASNLQKRAVHVKNSWGRRCNKLLFFSDVDDPSFPAVGLGTELGRDHLTAKTMRAFDYIYKNHFNDADWFMKADDDTYVVVENLRYMLSAHAPTEAVYFGQHFSVIVRQGYHSGGAGYVLSAEALRRFAKRDAALCAVDQGAEDVEMGRCLQNLHVATGDSRDKLGRSRFHCFNPQTHLHGGYPAWYQQYDKYGAKKGVEWISDYPVSFHYVTPEEMYDLEYFVYHMNAYGIINGLQDLNGPPDKRSSSTKWTTSTTTRPHQQQTQQQEQQKL